LKRNKQTGHYFLRTHRNEDSQIFQVFPPLHDPPRGRRAQPVRARVGFSGRDCTGQLAVLQAKVSAKVRGSQQPSYWTCLSPVKAVCCEIRPQTDVFNEQEPLARLITAVTSTARSGGRQPRTQPATCFRQREQIFFTDLTPA
ncbi:hypothetical protein GOODEAATRI_029240, partial [Goodea atripinnis]